METHLEKICEVCGGYSVSFQDALATCSRCSAHEHGYCMRALTFEVPPEWICDSCLAADQINSVDAGGKEDKSMPSCAIAGRVSDTLSSHKSFYKSSRQFHSQKQKPEETGKVKYLDTEEVIGLSSGAAKSGAPTNTTLSSRYGRSNVMTSLNPVRARPLNPKPFPARVEKTTRIHSGPSRPCRDGDVHKYPMIDKRVPQILKETKEIISPENNKFGTLSKKRKTELVEEAPSSQLPSCNSPKNISNVVPVITSEKTNFESSNEKIKTQLTEEPPRHQLPSSKLPCDFGAGGSTNDVADDNHSNIEFEDNFLPSKLITWKGCFRIVDSTASEIIEGFQAQPPFRVHRKAYEFSQKMPAVLQLKMLPRLHDSVDLFRDRDADRADISLYFFSSDDRPDRYRDVHNKLFERMEVQKSIMMGYVNGVELLIFTSKQLNIDLQSAFPSKTKKFFWGIFRKREPVNKELPLVISPLARAYPEELITDTASEDMEIDMTGGENVGRVDIVIKKESSTTAQGNQADRQIVVKTEIDTCDQRPELEDQAKPFFEDTKFIATWRRLQELCVGISPNWAANSSTLK